MDLKDNPFEGDFERAREHQERVSGLAEQSVKILESTEDSTFGYVEVRNDDLGIFVIRRYETDTRATLYPEGITALRENGIEVRWMYADGDGSQVVYVAPYDYIHGNFE